MVGFKALPAYAGSGDRFGPSAPTTAGPAEDRLSTPQDYEAALANLSAANNLALVWQCRFAPFAGNTGLYGGLEAGVSDPIVGENTFGFADGTHCYNPQNDM